MNDSANLPRRRAVIALLAMPLTVLATAAGCGENADQRTSGTLMKPLESVEKADEIAAKKAEAARAKNKKR